MTYILTHSGREVGIANDVVPSLADIAISLSRLPRFGGHARRPWSVLSHVLFTHQLAQTAPLNYAFPSLPLAMLLHDAHEACTGDIPTPFKSADMKHTQWALDLKIMDAYFPGGHDAYDYLHEQVKKVDHAALITEAYMVGPEKVSWRKELKQHFGAEPRSLDLWAWEHPLWQPEYGADRDLANSQCVDHFLDLYHFEYTRVMNVGGL